METEFGSPYADAPLRAIVRALNIRPKRIRGRFEFAGLRVDQFGLDKRPPDGTRDGSQHP
jgi:hypothetical protein